jgi:hypothetical protein
VPRSALVAVVALLVVSAPAQAASIVAPADGSTVGSYPSFVFDWPSGSDASVDVELSTEPELLTGGERIGHFVQRGPTDMFWLVTTGLRPEDPRPWEGGRLDAGTYYVRGWFDNYSAEPEYVTPVTRFTVRDEPIVVEGWLLRNRPMPKTRKCAQRLKVSGTYDYDDNSASDDARWVLKLKSGSQTLARFTGSDSFGGGSFSRTACFTKRFRGTVTATLAFIDAAKQVSTAAPKTFRV